jgi:hypothetical protein
MQTGFLIDYAEQGRRAARSIWNEESGTDSLADPRIPEFARAFVEELASCLKSLPAKARRSMHGAAIGAESLNQRQFQGIVEFIQNADDVRASSVRMAVRQGAGGQELLLVHDGQPVLCHHVIGMSLAFVTTKSDRIDQRGRFGIGLKTLKRIADTVSVHSAPYHFSAEMSTFGPVEPEPAIPGLYDPEHDTLIVCCLKDEIHIGELDDWFNEWGDDGLIFLASVQSLHYCRESGGPIRERRLRFGSWHSFSTSPSEPILEIAERKVDADSAAWTVWKAKLRVPDNLSPAHKARPDTIDISIALGDDLAAGQIYIGFKTGIPCTIPFSIDAPFDPGTSRESLIENAWNEWLIKSIPVVVLNVVAALFLEKPRTAWPLIPLPFEYVGAKDGSDWIGKRFYNAFFAIRELISDSPVEIKNAGRLSELIYEDVDLEHVLRSRELLSMDLHRKPLLPNARDVAGRWRDVLDTLQVSRCVRVLDLLQGFEENVFKDYEAEWWVAAGNAIAVAYKDYDINDDEEVVSPFTAPFLLSTGAVALKCQPRGKSKGSLLHKAPISTFAQKWSLFERLHAAYEEAGKEVIGWLTRYAAFTTQVDAETELGAFAEKFEHSPIEITDSDLREIRDRFDLVAPETADAVGLAVGRALLLDGYEYKNKKQTKKKVCPASAYLPKTLDREHPNWSMAAADTPCIDWISYRYEEQLKTTSSLRRRGSEGIVSRGPRKFLLLLGAETTPRLIGVGEQRHYKGRRAQDLARVGANFVQQDWISLDLIRVIESIAKSKAKERKERAPALMKAISRSWERIYAPNKLVPAREMKRHYHYFRGEVAARWLVDLQEREWVAIGRGELALPSVAVIKSNETQYLYDNTSFAIGLENTDIHPELAQALEIITHVRVSDMVRHLQALRDEGDAPNLQQVLQIYRNIARQCPKTGASGSVGDMSRNSLRVSFEQGEGLILTEEGHWRKPSRMFQGRNIFHESGHFVPSGPALAPLWNALDLAVPRISDCIAFLRRLANCASDDHTTAVLLDVYRYLEPLLENVEKGARDRLRVLPLYCSSGWISSRPVYYVANAELRRELAEKLIDVYFWEPPCDPRDLPNLMAHLGITQIEPSMSVMGDTSDAYELGESNRSRFMLAVECLSDELAKSAPTLRESIALDWDELKSIPLYLHAGPVSVKVLQPEFSMQPIQISLQALLLRLPLAIHISEDAIGERDQGGDIIATFFPHQHKRRIDNEWAYAWRQSRNAKPERIRLASDEEHRQNLEQQAEELKNAANSKGKAKFTPSTKRDSPEKQRTLKDTSEVIDEISVHLGGVQNTPVPASRRNLHKSPPQPSKQSGNSNAGCAYTNADLEQRGWELLTHILTTSENLQLVDFRRRHGVGADGAIDWKRFIELKATGGPLQGSIELSNAEYQRALEKGQDYILALVHGLERGTQTQIRLIIDPVRRTFVAPVGGVKLSRLADADAIIIRMREE